MLRHDRKIAVRAAIQQEKREREARRHVRWCQEQRIEIHPNREISMRNS